MTTVITMTNPSGTAETAKLIEIFNALIISPLKSFPIVDGNNII